MTARRFAGSLSALLVAAIMLQAPATAGESEAERYLGFRLLELDGAGVKWAGRHDGLSPAGATAAEAPRVTYAFATAPMTFPGARNCAGLVPVEPLAARSGIAPEALKTEARAAFDMWESAARIEFVETANADRADIVIGAQAEPAGHAFTNVAYEPGGGAERRIERSLICLNPMKRWKIGFDGNLAVYDLRYTLAHEIGHAIGLDHPDGNSALMSFRYREGSRHLTPGDMAGAAALYGPRMPSIETGTVTAPTRNGDAGEPAPPSELAIGQPR